MVYSRKLAVLRYEALQLYDRRALARPPNKFLSDGLVRHAMPQRHLASLLLLLLPWRAVPRSPDAWLPWDDACRAVRSLPNATSRNEKAGRENKLLKTSEDRLIALLTHSWAFKWLKQRLADEMTMHIIHAFGVLRWRT